ncbi:MAG: hypothetical protein JWO27_2921 [Frankiales bacterium]|nr:hypothetical protein [Frankiales bacterium]
MTVNTADTGRLARKAVRALPGKNAIGATRGDIADRAVAVGAVSAAGRQAFVALAEVNPEAALDAILAHTPASGHSTPATPVRAASGAPAAAAPPAVDPATDPTAHIGTRVRSGVRQVAGVLARSRHRDPVVADKTSLRASAGGPSFLSVHAADEAARYPAERSAHPGYDSRAVQPSATAAEQYARTQAYLKRMQDEQAARGIAW